MNDWISTKKLSTFLYAASTSCNQLVPSKNNWYEKATKNVAAEEVTLLQHAIFKDIHIQKPGQSCQRQKYV